MRSSAQAIAVLVLGLTGATALAETIYVKSKKADMKKESKGAAETLSSLNFGAQVTGTKKGQWWEVSHAGKKGFVYGGSITTDKESVKDDPSLTTKDGNKMSSEDVDAGSAVRGVGETATKYAGRNAITDAHKTYLDYHQSFIFTEKEPKGRVTMKGIVTVQIKEDDVESFLKEEKIGPYAQ